MGSGGFFSGTSDSKREHTHRHGVARRCANVNTNAHRHTFAHTHFSQHSALKVHEMLIGFCLKYLQRKELLIHHCIFATRPFHYLSDLSWTGRGSYCRDTSQYE